MKITIPQYLELINDEGLIPHRDYCHAWWWSPNRVKDKISNPYFNTSYLNLEGLREPHVMVYHDDYQMDSSKPLEERLINFNSIHIALWDENLTKIEETHHENILFDEKKSAADLTNALADIIVIKDSCKSLIRRKAVAI